MKKLLTLLCVIALLGTLCVPALAAGEPVPVVAEVSADWSTAFLYAWKGGGGAGNEIAAWPGVPMTAVDTGMFCTYMPADMENVIINDGNGAQTADLAVTPGQPVFVAAANIGEAVVEHELPIEVPSADELGVNLPSGSGAALTGDTWYVVGEFNDWNPADAAFKMDDNGDGTFLFIMDVLEGPHSMKVTNGTWDVNVGGDGADGNLEFTTSEGELTVLFDMNAGTITLTGADVVVGAAAPAAGDWYVAGTMNEWNPCDAAFKMDDNGDGTYTYILDVTAGSHAMKVTNGTWDVNFGGDGADGNLEFTTGDGELTITFDGTAISLSGADVVVGGTEPTEPAAPEGTDWYVAGDFNSWNQCDAAYKMTDNGNGTFSVTFAMTAGAHELKVTNGTWDVSFGKDGGADNFVYEAAADGNVTVTFTVDGAVIDVKAGEAPTTEPTTGATDDTTGATEGTTDNTNTTDSGNNNEEGDNGMLIGIIVAAAAVVVGGIVIFFILKKKD